MIRFLPFVLAALLATSAEAADKVCPNVGDKAPPFSLLMSDGSDGVSLRAALAKKVPVVLGFWAFHCEPCKKELPILERMSKELAGKATFVLIHVGPDETKMKAKAAELGVTIASASDDSEKKREKYCADALPLTYVLDAGGIVRGRIQDVAAEKYEVALMDELSKLGVAKGK